MSTLTTLTADLRADLMDQDAAAYKWTDAQLQRYIARALQEYQQVMPLIDSLTHDWAATDHPIDLSATTGYLYALAVEYPVDQHPATYLPFEELPIGSIYLRDKADPAVGSQLKVWYAKAHVVDLAGSTIPPSDESVVLLGARAHAYAAAATYTVGRINPSSWDTRNYRELATATIAQFRAELAAFAADQPAPHRWVSWAPSSADV